MDKYYVSGCIETESDCRRVEDHEADFFTLYESKENGLSHALLDCVDRLSVDSAMAVYMERDALQEQVKALAAESETYRRFFCYVMNCSFEGGDIDGGHIQDIALEFGLVRKEEYSAERHSHISSDPSAMEEGEDFFIINKPPATDAAIREIVNNSRAEGIHFAANRLLAAWESGFVDDTPAMAHDISGAVLSAVEFLPNANEGEFKRDYADEVRASIAAQLRAKPEGNKS